MASLGTKPRDRSHFAVKFAAGAMRVAALLSLIAGGTGAYAVLSPSQLQVVRVELPGILSVVVSALIVALAVVYALILWGFADGLVLLADIDDAQRRTQREVADLMLAQRTARGPFHAETVTQETERQR